MADVDPSELVPITREFLREFYQDYPIDPLSDGFFKERDEMAEMCDKMEVWDLIDKEALSIEPPKHLDRNMYFNRWQCEEVAYKSTLIEKKVEESYHGDLQTVVEMANTTAEAYEGFQKHQANNVNTLVEQFLPNDMRTRLINRHRERKELKYKQAVDHLVTSGGSIAEKYDLLWKQQWERRAGLADLGSASGVWKAVIKFLSGCPEVLMDFAKQINAPVGPTEEIRLKYGPNLYHKTRYANQAHIFASCVLAAVSDTDVEKQKIGLNYIPELKTAFEIYAAESKKYLDFMKDLVSKSPFFVSAEAVAKTMGSAPIKEEPFLHIVLSKGVPFETEVQLEGKSPILAYQFTLNRDVQFQVVNSAGKSVHGPELIANTGEMVEGLLSDLPEDKYKIVWESKAGLLRKAYVSYRINVVGVNESEEGWTDELRRRASTISIGKASGFTKSKSASSKSLEKIKS